MYPAHDIGKQLGNGEDFDFAAFLFKGNGIGNYEFGQF